LKDKVDILLRDKEELLQEISYLRAELASTKAELHAVNNMLRYGRDHHG
jgi:cell division septum initiation protein DivIVA